MKQKKWAAFVVAITVAVFGLLFTPRFPHAYEPLEKLRVAYIPVLDCLQLYVAKEKGFFKDEGLELELRAVPSGPVIQTLLEAGEIDVGWSAVMPTAMARSKGFDLQFIATGAFDRKGHKFQKIFVKNDSPYKSIKDVGESKISVNGIGSISHLGFLAVADSFGLDISKLKILETPFPQMEAALKEGQVDVAAIVEPFATITLINGVGRVIYEGYFPPEAGDLMVASWITKKAWVQKNLNQAKRFIRVINKATEFINHNPEELPEVISKNTKLTVDLVKKATLPAFTIDLKKSEIQITINMMTKYKFLKTPFEAKEVISDLLPMKE